MKGSEDRARQLLWELGRRSPSAGAVPPGSDEPDRETLMAFREGRLPAEQAEVCERLLGRSPAARARLAELAGPEEVASDPAVRERVLAAFGAARPAPRSPRRTSPRRRSGARTRGWLQAAAALLVAFGATVWLWPGVAPLPESLVYDVAATGLAEVRAAGPRGVRVDAYADTLVEITANPRGAVEDVVVGLYRQDAAGRLEPIPFGSEVRLEMVRGAARVTSRAAELTVPGSSSARLFMIIARPGDLPRGGELATGTEALRALEADGRRRLHPLEIRVLAGPPAAP